MRVRGVVEPLLARVVDHLLRPGEGRFLFEPKWDGFRAIGVVDDNRGVHLRSRRGTRFNDVFPEVMWALYEHLPAATVVDGEIVRWSPLGRRDFAALQRRNTAGRRAADLARAEPFHYIVFDLLEAEGEDLRHEPLTRRRQMLEQMFAGVPAAATLALSMATDQVEQARTWLATLPAAGV